MKTLAASRFGVSLLLLALLPSACVVDSASEVASGNEDDSAREVDSLDETGPAGFRMLDRAAMVEKLQPHSETDVEVLPNVERGTAAVVMGRFPIASLGPRAGASAREKARAFIDLHHDVFGTEDVAKDLEEIADEKDDLGSESVTFRQVHKGIEVYGSTVKVHFSADGEHVEYVSNDLLPGVRSVTTTPTITHEQAIDSVRGLGRSGEVSAAPKLFIHVAPDRGLRSPRLVWALDVHGEGSFRSARYFVDAENGTVVDKISLTPTLVPVDESDSEGAQDLPTQPRLQVNLGAVFGEEIETKALSGGMTTVTYDAANTNNNPGTKRCTNGTCSNANDEIDTLDEAVEDTMALFFTDFKRKSFDNGWFGGATVRSIGRYLTKMDNEQLTPHSAFWLGGAEKFFYGPHLGTLDVVAHEYTHAVTEHSAGLIYKGQSGALDESFSDIFSSYVQSSKNKDLTWTWKIGQHAPAEMKGPCGALRDISNPPSCARPGSTLPKTTGGYVLTCDDEEGVHYNSGIVAYAYYNFAKMVGADIAGKVFYKALTKYLTPQSKLEAARTAALKATLELYCKGGSVACPKVAGTQKLLNKVLLSAFLKAGLDGTWVAPSQTCPVQTKEGNAPGLANNPKQYKGCFTDQAAPRSLPHLLIAGGATINSCTQAARGAGYPYAGLQNGGECWAGYDLAGAKKGDSECNMACTADSKQKCGGFWRNAIWYVPAAADCAHSPTVAGSKLAAGCSPCVTSVCSYDEFCCTDSWDAWCSQLAEVSEICSQADICAHSTAVVGVKLAKGCSACVKSVCAYDSQCCDSTWSQKCVNEAKADGNCN